MPRLGASPSRSDTVAAPDVRSDDDGELVARSRLDPAAFAPLYDRYVGFIYRYCAHRLGSREAAEDATSRVFVKALSGLPRYRGDATFRSWLFAIAHNEIVDAGRAVHPWQPLEAASDVPDRSPSPEDLALVAEGERALQALLARLSPDQRRIVELRLAGLTAPEIAAVLDQGLSAVKMAQFRAYARLRSILAEGDARQEAHDGER